MGDDPMKRTCLAFLMVSISVFAVLCTTMTSLAAPPTRQPFSATIQSGPPQSIEKMWVDEEGITHIRGASLTGTMAGDINGQIVGKENLNVDATFAGDLQVKAVIEVASEPLYKMSADLVIKAYVLSGTFVIQGTGSLKGIQIKGTISGTLGDTTATLAGTQVIVHP